MATNVLQIRGLNQHYGESHTLWDLDIDVPPQQCTVVMGRNGVGKSTLMLSVMGIVPIKTGEMLYRGKAIQRLDASIRAHLGIGYVPQGRQIFPLLTVEENLKLGLRARADGASSIPSQVFERFPVLKEMSHRRGGDLSGGQQQQLAIPIGSGPAAGVDDLDVEDSAQSSMVLILEHPIAVLPNIRYQGYLAVL